VCLCVCVRHALFVCVLELKMIMKYIIIQRIF
jgi:hypothetical protein